MPIQFHAENGGKILVTQATGMVSKADYKSFIAEFERLLKKQGKLRILVDITDFHGLTSDGVLEDIKLYVKHKGDIERIAVIGDKRWEQVLTNLGKPFMPAQMQYFDLADANKAKKWLSEDASNDDSVA